MTRSGSCARTSAWKVAAGVSLTDEGFHPTVLTLWRNRLRASDRPERIFDAVREVVAETGVLNGKIASGVGLDGARRCGDPPGRDHAAGRADPPGAAAGPDSQGAHAHRRTITTTIRASLRARGTTAPTIDRGRHRARERCVDTCSPRSTESSSTTQQAEAVGLLALVAGQDVEPGDGDGTWRIAPRTTPDRMVSVVDPESRHVHKTNHNYRDGFKAHIAHRARHRDRSPRVTSRPATSATPKPPPGSSPSETERLEVLADSAYGAGEFRATLAAAEHTAPDQADPAASRHIEGGFTIDDFTIDLDARTVTCPSRSDRGDHRETATRRSVSKCDGCALRQRCTHAVDGKNTQDPRAPRRCSPPHAHTPTPTSSSRPTDNIGRWSNASSRGSSPAVIAKCASAASRATASASRTAAPRSTSDDSSTSASTRTATDG